MFKITKIGLLNFWLFDEEEFKFSDGKLLLRGKNGSGKSVTMQSFIPLILDGNKQPSRLDPFGSKEKRIEDYLLGPSDGAQKNEATAYLYMETYNEETDKYITIGMGLRARIGRPTDFWGFGLCDNKRIGEDFFLYKDYGSKVLYNKGELRARIGTNNRFVETQKDYKAMVNDLLYGFESLDSYDEFINVLLQLRSPKLSRGTKPVDLLEVLTKVLQPLSIEDLRPLSDAIEDTNKTKEQILNLENQLKSLTNFLKTYKNYNEILLYNKAVNYKNAEKELESKRSEISDKEKLVEDLKNELDSFKNSYIELEKENDTIIARLDAIDERDLERQAKELDELTKELESLKQRIEMVESLIQKKVDKRISIEASIKDYDDKLYNSESLIKEISTDIISLLDDIKLNDIKVELSNILDNSINFTYIIDRIRSYKETLTKIKIKLESVDNLEKDINNRQEELDKINKKVDELDKELISKKQHLSDAIMDFKDSINTLNKSNKMVVLNDDEKLSIFNLMDNYNSSNYMKSRDIYLNLAHNIESDNEKELAKVEHKLNDANIELDKLNIELEELISNKELDYESDTETLDTLDKLKSMNIKYVELYKAIEFKDNIDKYTQNRIEELLSSLNILNAIIVNNKDLSKVNKLKGMFLKSTKKKDNNLLKYFNVVNTDIDSSVVESILSSISVDGDYSINDEMIKLDFIIGYPGKLYKSKYIGIFNREKERNRLISKKQVEINDIGKIIENYKNIISTINNKLETVKEESKLFPTSTNIDKIEKSITDLNITMNELSKLSSDITSTITKLTKEVEDIFSEINKLSKNIDIPINTPSYNNALSNIDIIQKNIYELKSIYESYQNTIDIKNTKKLELDDNEIEISDKRDELSQTTISLNKVKSKIDAINEMLNNPKNKGIIDELKSLRSRLNDIPKEKENISLRIGQNEEKINNNTIVLNSTKDNIKKYEVELEIKDIALKRELDLGYVYNEDVNASKIIKDLDSHKNDDVMRAQSNYFSAYNDYRNDLLDYRINSKEIFNDNDTYINKYVNDSYDEDGIRKLFNENIRYDITAAYQGKYVNLYELEACIKSSISDSELYITTQERHLFEDILLKTVGRKIRDRINESKAWVRKMNDIMNSTSVDSDLSFSLEWKNKQAYTEDELDTKELVRLFQIDSGAISTKDSDALINHFRSKIKQELEYNDSALDNYTSVIAHVLDYRNWFEFKIYYKRKYGEKKELTNKAFSVFSGGERAKSMYIPLFAAVYSKLESADKKALRIIALDEAFAGVDDININELFDILGKLNLDYILTSQALWGDYEKVKDLAICELTKDESIKAVAVQHFHWNGKVKVILDE